jgi:hypothetical protein
LRVADPASAGRARRIFVAANGEAAEDSAMAGTDRSDRVSESLMRFLEALTPAELEQFKAVMREPNTYFAENLTDLLAILDDLKRH